MHCLLRLAAAYLCAAIATSSIAEAGGGACCLPDGSCAIASAAECAAGGGAFQGDGTLCEEVVCPLPPGACCLPDGSCRFLARATCDGFDGVFHGSGVSCADVVCPPPHGACCFLDGTCADLLQSECNALDGFFQGHGTTCGAVECLPPKGACCLPGGACAFVTAQECADAAGAFQGVAVFCADVTCPLPLGACCLPGGACALTDLTACLVQGGEYQGEGVPCTASLCGMPPRGGGTTKGSLVYFTKVELRWGAAPAYQLLQDTFLSLTNDGASPVRVLMHFVNGDPPLPAVFDGAGNLVERAHPGWNRLDNEMTLTANQPVYWSVLSGQPAAGGLSPFAALDPGMPPGRPDPEGRNERVLRGFVIGWAVNESGAEIRWNHLAGNGTIVNYAEGSAWEYVTHNHRVVSAVGEGQPPDGTPGELHLDGIEYAAAYGLILYNFQAVGAAAFSGPVQVVGDADLTLLLPDIDLRQTTTGPATTKASFDVWNMNEVKFSGLHRCVTCWNQTLLSGYAAGAPGVPNHFLLANLQTPHGKARIDGLAAPLQCDVLDDPDTPGDESVTSIARAIVGVAARRLVFDGGRIELTGYPLVGMGTQSAVVRYDVIAAPPEGEAPKAPTRRLRPRGNRPAVR
jgi:hypothetical protein